MRSGPPGLGNDKRHGQSNGPRGAGGQTPQAIAQPRRRAAWDFPDLAAPQGETGAKPLTLSSRALLSDLTPARSTPESLRMGAFDVPACGGVRHV